MCLWQCHPNFLIFFFAHWNMKMGWVWKKSVMTIMGLILLCRLKFRVWRHAHMGRLRSKIFFTSYQLPKRSHGSKFRQNPRNWTSARSYDLENLSVKEKFVLKLPWLYWSEKDIAMNYTFCDCNVKLGIFYCWLV